MIGVVGVVSFSSFVNMLDSSGAIGWWWKLWCWAIIIMYGDNLLWNLAVEVCYPIDWILGTSLP